MIGVVATLEPRQPDVEAFFGALETVVEAGIVLIVLLVGVMAIRRFTSL